MNATITALNNRSSATAEDTTGLPSLIQAYCALLLSLVPVRTDFSIQFLDVIWYRILLGGGVISQLNLPTAAGCHE